MAQYKKYIFDPNKWFVVILFGCILGSCFLLFNRPRHVAGTTPPEVLLVLSLWALIREWRTVIFGEHSICIHYHPVFIKRDISFDRVGNVEHIQVKREHYMLVSLTGCPALADSKCRSLFLYTIMHPFRVIAIRCSKSDYEICLSIFSQGRKDRSPISSQTTEIDPK